MRQEISRREFFELIGQTLHTPIRVAFLLAIAWLIIAAFEAARGITFYGWRLIGSLVLAAIALAAIQYGGARLYCSLPLRAKAVCAASAEAFKMLALIAAGALIWHGLQTEQAVGVVMVAIVCIAYWVIEAYNRRLRELKSLGTNAGQPQGRPSADQPRG